MTSARVNTSIPGTIAIGGDVLVAKAALTNASALGNGILAHQGYITAGQVNALLPGSWPRWYGYFTRKAPYAALLAGKVQLGTKHGQPAMLLVNCKPVPHAWLQGSAQAVSVMAQAATLTIPQTLSAAKASKATASKVKAATPKAGGSKVTVTYRCVRCIANKVAEPNKVATKGSMCGPCVVANSKASTPSEAAAGQPSA